MRYCNIKTDFFNLHNEKNLFFIQSAAAVFILLLPVVGCILLPEQFVLIAAFRQLV